MTFCFSFEVLVTLNPIHVDIKGGGPTKEAVLKQYCNFLILEVTVYRSVNFYSVILQVS